MENKFPYGKCDCSTGIVSLGCCGGNGPAAFEVTRNGKRLKVCTRCDLSTDQAKICLVKQGDNLDVFSSDPLGALCLTFTLQELSAADEGKIE